MKEDVLEQLVDVYLQAGGYFTRHNLKFRPRSDHPEFVLDQDSNHSDIDVLGYHPMKDDPQRVVVVSCKSWQAGFNVSAKLTELGENKIRSGREVWKAFRELVHPKWSEAFISAIRAATGSTRFTYVTAVTAIKGDPSLWERHPPFQEQLRGNPIRLLSLADMLKEVVPQLGTTVAASNLGRTLQLLRASGCRFELPTGSGEPRKL